MTNKVKDFELKLIQKKSCRHIGPIPILIDSGSDNGLPQIEHSPVTNP
jgi:hypothetical protein